MDEVGCSRSSTTPSMRCAAPWTPGRLGTGRNGPGQYRLDLAADAAALPILHGAGLAVLSEESGVTGDAVGAALGGDRPGGRIDQRTPRYPFYATSICVLDAEGPLVGVVVNQATGVALRGRTRRGPRRDGAVVTSGCDELRRPSSGSRGFPGFHPGWAQFRAFGAASLEFCAVAEGTLDAYPVVGTSTLFGWDYLAGMLVCTEAGAVTRTRRPDVVVRTRDPRPIVAATKCAPTAGAEGHMSRGRPGSRRMQRRCWPARRGAPSSRCTA